MLQGEPMGIQMQIALELTVGGRRGGGGITVDMVRSHMSADL